MNLKSKFYKFMQGRYGMDQFSRFLLILGVVFYVISLFTRGNFWNMFSFAIIIYCYFRILSRNHTKRYEENQKYAAYAYKVQCFIRAKKNYILQFKTYRIYHCPECRQKIRVPRGKGKISIHCPKCNTDFIKNS
ncbi:MAG: hypothetical protein RR920_00060 [Lachnospiraceae bacterium]